MQLRIAGHDRSAIGPRLRFLYQPGADGIRQDVKTDFGKGSAPPFFLAQDVVVCLMLKMMRAQDRGKMFAQEFHSVALVGINAQPHPEQVNMVGHQAIGWADQPFPGGGMKHYLAESRVENFVQPAGAAQGDGQCPVNDRVALIIFAGQSREIKAPIHALAGKAIGCGGGFRLHGKENRAGSRRLPHHFVASNVSSIISSR